MGNNRYMRGQVIAADDFRQAVSMYHELLEKKDFNSMPEIDENLSRLRLYLKNITSADATVLRNAIPDLRSLNMTNYARGLLGELVRSGIYEADSSIPRVTPRLALFNALSEDVGVSACLEVDNFYDNSPIVAEQLRRRVAEIYKLLPEIY